MSQKFEEYYKNIEEGEVEFLIEFMFQLTIVGRDIHHDFTGEKQLSASKQLNEINHRILNRIRALGNKSAWCKKEYLLKIIPHHVSLAPQISVGVAYAAGKASSKLNA